MQDSEGKFTDKLNLQKVQDKLIGDGFMDAESLFIKEGTSLDDLADSFGTTKDAMWSFLQYWNQFLDEAHQFKLEDFDLGLDESAEQIGERVTQAVESLKSVGVLSDGLELDLDLSGYDTVEEKVAALDKNLDELSRAKVGFEEDSASYALIEGRQYITRSIFSVRAATKRCARSKNQCGMTSKLCITC